MAPMRITADIVKTNDWVRKLGDLQEQALEASIETIEDLGEVYIKIVDHLAPKDTNRYINGWIEAGRQADLRRKQLS